MHVVLYVIVTKFAKLKTTLNFSFRKYFKFSYCFRRKWLNKDITFIDVCVKYLLNIKNSCLNTVENLINIQGVSMNL